jgi:tripartite-type tricarboxylate transporter receptor subunit TctC
MSISFRKFFIALSSCFMLAVPLQQAMAANTSIKQIVVPLGPGSGADQQARAISDRLGNGTVVLNRPGANGILTIQEVLKDTNSIMISTESIATTNRLVLEKFDSDHFSKIQPVIAIASMPYVILANSKYQTLEKIIDEARSTPGKINAGYVTALEQALIRHIEKTYQVKFNQIPYKTFPGVDVMNGSIEFTVTTSASAMSSNNDRAKILLVMSDDPIEGVDRSVIDSKKLGAWSATNGVFISKDVPKNIVENINRQIDAILKDPEIKRILERNGVKVRGGNVDAFRRMIDINYNRQKDLL